MEKEFNKNQVKLHIGINNRLVKAIQFKNRRIKLNEKQILGRKIVEINHIKIEYRYNLREG